MDDQSEDEGEGDEHNEKRRRLQKRKKSDYQRQMAQTMITQLAPPGVLSLNQTQVSLDATRPLTRLRPAERW